MIVRYAVIGNHDRGYGETGVQAQIDKTKDDTYGLWNMPATNYTKRFEINDVVMQIIFIDTTTLAPTENSCCNSNGCVINIYIMYIH